ncbi:MAG: indolepyruvate ferredoxin oxidoreductase subunit alpha [Candidatus Wallbacteria bacterium HGW-Wallbacteria-1]|uniref:Indolepyruvate oxidoreductase subunit IorA n=1 Tax=Candidatus Wallbacteria bacterium HGW-Wallbacteria-1 TaxID=2013854 RepID=A0A2N1PQY6_9BACT|nr:MAG: indolepyruvate ferredoxin oxidoreductase subunit alpha [Candidatus Wallbacteria bacterium HGW-Wallbacteria-1]
MKKALLSGNEAIARGFWESGGHRAFAYPGTPSTEILENLAKYDDIYCQWNTNEKTAMETAAGASVAGARTIVTMKHVGLNVAADPLMTTAYTGVNGGLVIVSADDPGMHSSQNEQDNRRFGIFAKMPVLNPSDSQEAKDFVGLGFEISERFDIPVLLRITTRIAHSKTLVTLKERTTVPIREYVKNIKKNMVIPAHARILHVALEKKLIEIQKYASTCPANSLHLSNPEVGIVTSGIAVQYAREVFPDASFLTIGMDFPFPVELARKLADHCERILVIEELEPVLEEQLTLLGIKVEGKNRIPICDELNQAVVARAFDLPCPDPSPALDHVKLPGRPPVLCPGCSHRPLFLALKKMKLIVNGDIGCYTLGALPPLDAMDTCICMGASITQNLGFEKTNPEFGKKSVAVIGDSTFFHSGMTGIADLVYNSAHSTVIILDNLITAMTGHQNNPGTGLTLMGKPSPIINIAEVCKALGVEKIITLNPYDVDNNMKMIQECLDHPGPAVIIARAPCMLIKKHKVTPALEVDPEKCRKCGACIRTGCPAVSKSSGGQAIINPEMCAGEACGLCRRVCKFNAHKAPVNRDDNQGR